MQKWEEIMAIEKWRGFVLNVDSRILFSTKYIYFPFYFLIFYFQQKTKGIRNISKKRSAIGGVLLNLTAFALYLSGYTTLIVVWKTLSILFY